ncbi:hypothetical protein JCM10213_006174 [Rhodosporidiobolus nylandii]
MLPGLGRKELSDAERELLGLPPAEESWERLKGESKPKLEALLFCAEELSAVESSAAFTERTNLEAQVQALRGDRAALRGMLGCLLSNVPDLDLEMDWASELCRQYRFTVHPEVRAVLEKLKNDGGAGPQPGGEEGDMEDKDMDAAADNEEGTQPRAQDGGGVAGGKEEGADVEMKEAKAPPPRTPSSTASSLGKEEQRTHDGQSSKDDGEDVEMADQPADKRDEEIRNLKKELARLNLKAYGLGRPGDRDVRRQWAFEAAVWSNPEHFTDKLKKENSLPTGVELRVGQGLEGPSLKMPLKFERKMEYVSGVHAIADLGFNPIFESVGAMKVTRSEKDKIDANPLPPAEVKMWAAPSNNITPGKMCGHYATFQEGFLNGKATLVPTAKDGAKVSEAKGSFAKGRTDAFPSTRKEQLKFLAEVEGEVGGRLPKRKMKGDKEVVVGVDVKGNGKGEWAYGGGEVKTTFTASTSKISFPLFASSASISPQPVPGISSFYGYEGDRPGFWAGHVEDCRLPSTNTQQRGRKLWYVLPPGYEEKMWKLLKEVMPQVVKEVDERCPQR